MNINIQVIPHSEHRYETVGDWWETPEGDLEIRVSSMGNWKFEFLVAFHEQAEFTLCKDRGITDEIVSKFDKEFESNRQEGNEDEPGDDPKAPYRKEHFFATSIERLMAAELNVDWEEYDAAIYAL